MPFAGPEMKFYFQAPLFLTKRDFQPMYKCETVLAAAAAALVSCADNKPVIIIIIIITSDL